MSSALSQLDRREIEVKGQWDELLDVACAVFARPSIEALRSINYRYGQVPYVALEVDAGGLSRATDG